MSKSTTTPTPEIVDRLLHSLNATSKRLSNDVEKQAKQAEKRIKLFLDAGEKTADRWMKSIDKDFRAQLASLRHEVERLSSRLNEFLGQASKPTVAKRALAKKAPGAKRAPAAKKALAKKAPGVKKAATTKSTAHTTPAKSHLAA